MVTSVQNHLQEKFNQPLVDKLQTRGIRRTLVAIMLVVLAATGWALTLIPEHLWLLAVIPGPFMLATGMLNRAVRGIFELEDSRLDEYQRGLRNAAYKTAYGYTLVFLVLIATLVTGMSLPRIEAFGVAAFGFLAAALAPRMIVAWSLADEPEEEAPLGDQE